MIATIKIALVLLSLSLFSYVAGQSLGHKFYMNYYVMTHAGY